MPDLSQMSDEDLLKLHQSYQAQPSVAPAAMPTTGLEHLSDDELLKMYHGAQPNNSEQQPNAVRVPLGIAQGVAEAMNPVNIPHNMEVMYRAFGPASFMDMAKGNID